MSTNTNTIEWLTKDFEIVEYLQSIRNFVRNTSYWCNIYRSDVQCYPDNWVLSKTIESCSNNYGVDKLFDETEF